jgi:hypothetical protein
VDCGVCVGGSSGRDASEVLDCMGMQRHGQVQPMRRRPTTTTATRVLQRVGLHGRLRRVCVEGLTGVLPNLNRCNSTCFGNSTTNDRGVATRRAMGSCNSWQDCSGVQRSWALAHPLFRRNWHVVDNNSIIRACSSGGSARPVLMVQRQQHPVLLPAVRADDGDHPGLRGHHPAQHARDW